MYIGSFWSQPYDCKDNEVLFDGMIEFVVFFKKNQFFIFLQRKFVDKQRNDKICLMICCRCHVAVPFEKSMNWCVSTDESKKKQISKIPFFFSLIR